MKKTVGKQTKTQKTSEETKKRKDKTTQNLKNL